MKEVWRAVRGFEGYYEVSNLGNVASVVRVLSFKEPKHDRTIGGRLLKGQVDKCGYVRVRVCADKVKTTLKVHREVASAFIPNPHNKPQVNHLDGDKQNNLVSNLEWVTNSENQLHAIAIGKRVHPTAELSYRFSGSVEVYLKGVLEFTVRGNKEMADKGLDYRLVSRCLSGKSKTHKGYTFIKRTT